MVSEARPAVPSAPQQQTTFQLAQQERLPVYETVPAELPAPTTTIPFFLRGRMTTPYRPRIMKYSPKPASVQQEEPLNNNAIDTAADGAGNNDPLSLSGPSAEMRPGVMVMVTNPRRRLGQTEAGVDPARYRFRTTTQGNLINIKTILSKHTITHDNTR